MMSWLRQVVAKSFWSRTCGTGRGPSSSLSLPLISRGVHGFTDLSSPLLQELPQLNRKSSLPLTSMILREFHASPAVQGLPGVKKKKKMDPAIIKMREERRVRRITRALNKMKRRDRIPRPILELEVEPRILAEKEIRTRKVCRVFENYVFLLFHIYGRGKTLQISKLNFYSLN